MEDFFGACLPGLAVKPTGRKSASSGCPRW